MFSNVIFQMSATPVILDDSRIIGEGITAASTGGNETVNDISKVNLSSSIIWASLLLDNLSSYQVVLIIQIWEPLNPIGAERLPRGIVVSESDLFLRRLWGLPKEVRRRGGVQ